MSDDRIRHKAERVVYDWKLTLDKSRVPVNIHITNEDELVDLIEEAIRGEVRYAIN
jgi:hypothetical protein